MPLLLPESLEASSEIVPGRVLRLAITRRGCTVVIWNIHNYGLSPELRLVAVQLGADMRHARERPDEVFVMAVGDFNLPLALWQIPQSRVALWRRVRAVVNVSAGKKMVPGAEAHDML